MLAVLFAVSYQSIHTFSHDHHVKSECCDDSHHLTFKTSEKTFTESDDCPICDFKFAAFLSPEVFQFDFIPSKNLDAVRGVRLAQNFDFEEDYCVKYELMRLLMFGFIFVFNEALVNLEVVDVLFDI